MHQFEIIEIADSLREKIIQEKSARSTITTRFSETQIIVE